MAVVVAEHETPHPYALRGRGDGGQRDQRSKLVAEWLLDEMVAEQKRGEACLLGPMSRLHQLLGRADALPQKSESKRAWMHHASSSLCSSPRVRITWDLPRGGAGGYPLASEGAL